MHMTFLVLLRSRCSAVIREARNVNVCADKLGMLHPFFYAC